MNDVYVWLTAILFTVAVFPVHIYNYLYLNTEIKYASVNAGVYKFNFFNANTVENSYREMQINGKSKRIDATKFSLNYYRIFNRLCIYKIIQLGDYGMRDSKNAYILLAQNGFTTAIYKFMKINGNYCKLRNYTVINREHSEVRYYAKAVTILNVIVVIKILFIILTEKLNERKT